ncbi:MAG TPA: hypothetical protein DCE44_24090 [Verrucomicrobiales bacterium]|nr:hypothetical protein [Verrucomicrobiales bacterium]
MPEASLILRAIEFSEPQLLHGAPTIHTPAVVDSGTDGVPVPAETVNGRRLYHSGTHRTDR